VIGHESSALPSHPALRAMGRIDKSRDLARFIELVRSFHFGCLLSPEDEAFGLSTLECLRLGVPVIGTAVGGIPETVPENAGLIVPSEHSGKEIAELLDAVLRDPDRYASMREAARRVAGHQTWDRTASEFLTLLDGDGPR
jgi:glycosyltransferase involved in cell wall biosynthesis